MDLYFVATPVSYLLKIFENFDYLNLIPIFPGPSSFHAYCLDPILTELPGSDENWSCPRCMAPQPKNKPEKFITWRWKYFEYPDPVDEADLLKEGENEDEIDQDRKDRLMLRPPRKLEPHRERELFVKWKYVSYTK